MIMTADSWVPAYSCPGCGLVLISLARSVLGTNLAERQVESAKKAFPLCADCRAAGRKSR